MTERKKWQVLRAVERNAAGNAHRRICFTPSRLERLLHERIRRSGPVKRHLLDTLIDVRVICLIICVTLLALK